LVDIGKQDQVCYAVAGSFPVLPMIGYEPCQFSRFIELVDLAQVEQKGRVELISYYLVCWSLCQIVCLVCWLVGRLISLLVSPLFGCLGDPG